MNFQQYAVIPGNAAQPVVDSFKITCQVFDEQNNKLADYTGDAALDFHTALASLSIDQQSEVVGAVAQTIVLMKAGLQ